MKLQSTIFPTQLLIPKCVLVSEKRLKNSFLPRKSVSFAGRPTGDGSKKTITKRFLIDTKPSLTIPFFAVLVKKSEVIELSFLPSQDKSTSIGLYLQDRRNKEAET